MQCIYDKTKHRKYYGKWYTIPLEAKFMACDTDDCGANVIWCYTTRPKLYRNKQGWFGAYIDGKIYYTTRKINAKKSLRCV